MARNLKWFLVCFIALDLFPNWGHSALSFDKQCGDLNCQEHNYCRQVDHTCQPCSGICNKSNNNFDQTRCEVDCQDYLHDLRYQRVQNDSGELLLSSEIAQLYQNVQKDVLVLKILVGISLIVISITIATFIAFVFYFWRVLHPSQDKPNKDNFKEDNNKPNKGVELPTIYNNKYREASPVPPQDLDTGINSSATQSPSRSAEISINNSLNSSSAATPTGTMSTLVNGSGCDSVGQGVGMNNNNKSSIGKHGRISQRFRREPSESTLPDYVGGGNDNKDKPSHSPQYYSHHV